MNPKLKFIFQRRCVRKFTTEPVSDALIRDLLEAAMAAPSAVAKDPWRFHVVREAVLRNRIADGLPNGQMLRLAPVGIFVEGDLSLAHSGELSYLIQDCSAAIENLLLAATALGLGACWLGVHPRPDRIILLSTLFKLPQNRIPIAVIAIGHPDEHPTPRTRYRETAVEWSK
jgi:nitroreductase